MENPSAAALALEVRGFFSGHTSSGRLETLALAANNWLPIQTGAPDINVCVAQLWELLKNRSETFTEEESALFEVVTRYQLKILSDFHKSR